MTSRHANRYAARAANAARASNAEKELSAQAYACLLSPPDNMPAQVFNELLEKEYLQAAKRGWRWTAKAESARARA